MARTLSLADVPAAAWQHINALPGLYRQRNDIRARLGRICPRTRRADAAAEELRALTAEALRREAALRQLGITLAAVTDLNAPARRHWTESADA